MKNPSRTLCPCDPTRKYASCCGRWHAGQPAPDAESLMRSRYSAWTLGLEAYLLSTWHPLTRPSYLDLGATPDLRPTWLGLQIKEYAATGSDTAEVEFIARFREGGASAKRLHERSRFVRQSGQWLYLDGRMYSTE